MDGQGTTWRKNIAENFNRLSRAHERYRRQTDRQTDGRRHIANMNLSSRSLKMMGKGKEGKGRKGWEKTPPLLPHKMNFCLQHCMYMRVVMVDCASCRVRGY